MKNFFSVLLAILSFISTHTFASTINVKELKKITKTSSEGKNSTATCGFTKK